MDPKRKGVFAICGLYAVIFAAAWISTAMASGMDNMSRGMSLGFIMVGIGFTLIFAIPALILAGMDKAPGWALGLSLVPLAAAILMMMSGGV